VIRYMSNIRNAWFKFVVSTEKDVEEIESMFLAPKLILREQVLLMPQGETREELAKNREAVIEMAIAHDVRYTTREHIVVWDKTVGI
jgi:7-carboxy-7-deazaguanine synthase